MKNIQPILKRLHSPDVFDLEHSLIDASRPFCVLLQAMVGPEEGESEESFDILVCNPKWIEQKVDDGIFSGYHYLIVKEFNIGDIREYIESKLIDARGSTWQVVAEKLGRLGKWEFEDYSN